MFSANQVGVNRPVEDRWRVCQFGLPANKPSYRAAPDLSLDTNYGGTVYTVVDGHGGHACAHAVNLLHSDYILAGILPSKQCESLLTDLRRIEDSRAQYTIRELAEVLWSSPEARITPPSSELGSPTDVNPTRSQLEADQPPLQWAPWGPWGPLASSVLDVHWKHLCKFVEESLSTSLEGVDYVFDDNDCVDLRDPEGFLIASIDSIQETVDSLKLQQLDSSESRALKYFQTVAGLQTHISSTATALRNSLRRFDLDVTTKALPRNQGVPLDKALLRIAFSGCVTTSAYVPHNGKELYISQVGDCGAVLGSYSPASLAGQHSETSVCADGSCSPLQMTTFSPDDWTGELLVAPHNVDNEADVERLKNSHPVHESCFVIREDRLLGELVPLRAFGDIRFKWQLDDLKHVARLLDLPPNYPIVSSFYTSPPYLISTPQVVWRPLVTGRDYFLILATDGLWDMISAKEAVNVVARHWFDYQGKPTDCGAGDTAASRLIRTALGGDAMDIKKISVQFSLPATVARYYRDDITVIVAYLPSAFEQTITS